ncbi:TPA: hypothetical protein ACFNMW_001553, partial [Neisseria lactamica]
SGIFDDSDSAKQAVKRFGVFMMRQIRISLSAKTATPLENGEIDGDTGGNKNGGSGGLKPILHPHPAPISYASAIHTLKYTSARYAIRFSRCEPSGGAIKMPSESLSDGIFQRFGVVTRYSPRRHRRRLCFGY